jgi:predicted nucleic acid-binding protein
MVSELRKPDGSPAVKAFVALVPSEDLFLSVITIGEITTGVGLLPEGEKRRALTVWLRGLSSQFADRILPLDQETSEISGEITAAARKGGGTIHTAEGLMAATALRYGLHVATRDTAPFEKAGAMVINPWLRAQ